MTDAEKTMWRVLRGRQLAGFKFRRQVPIGRYIVDFAYFSHRLVVEIDGGQHADPTSYEDRRSRFFVQEGLLLLRFWNNEVLENRAGIGERIVENLLNRSPHPPALRAGPSLSHEGRGD